jgi:hypothetical protein
MTLTDFMVLKRLVRELGAAQLAAMALQMKVDRDQGQIPLEPIGWPHPPPRREDGHDRD